MGLAACGGGKGISKVPSATLRVAYAALASTLDPQAWRDATGPRTFAPVFDALTFVQDFGTLRPALALAWSQLTPTTWQFRLRVNDAKFHNGEMFGPESVKFTFDRLLNPANNLPLRPLLSTVERVDVLDPATVNVITQRPDPLLLHRLSLVYMLPPRYFDQVGPEGFGQHPIGTGFWKFEGFVPQKRLHLKLFRDTWRGARGADPPPLNRLQIEVMPDVQTRASALRNLQVDVATQLTSALGQGLQAEGFGLQTTDFSRASSEQAWQRQAFGAPLCPPVDVLATASNVKGIAALPSGSWWFDRVTKTELQRIAVAGGA